MAIPVAIMRCVAVAIVQVVHVIAVRECDVATAFAVGVRVLVVNGVGHDSSLKGWGFSISFQ